MVNIAQTLYGARSEDEIDAVLNARLAENRRKRLIESGVPDRFLAETFETYLPRTEEEARNRDDIKAFAESAAAGFLVILGGFGVGKTHLSSACLQIRDGLYVDIPTLELEYECARDFSAQENRLRVLGRYAKAPFLIIDEIGRASNPATEKAILYYLANRRYSFNTPTVLVSNFEEAPFAEYLGAAIIDRIAEKRTRVIFTGSSYRRRNLEGSRG